MAGKAALSMLAIGLLSACAGNAWTEKSRFIDDIPGKSTPEAATATASKQDAERERFFETPPPPTRANTKPVVVSKPVTIPDEPGKEATVVFNSMPLPQFIDSVFGVVLKQTISIDPAIQQRRDLVSMRADKPQSPSQLYASAKAVLQSYGVVVKEFSGLTRFVPDSADTSSLPEIRRGRALPEVPEALRPQFYVVELDNTVVSSVTSFVRNTFGDKVTVRDDAQRNAIILSGTPSNVSAAMQAVQALDQPLMRGQTSARIVPTYWSAEELSRRLNDILLAEGYFASTSANTQAPIVLLPVGPINSIIVFSTSPTTLEHVLRWAEELDRPSEARNSNYFIYPVRNADASEIAATLSQIMGISSPAAPAPASASAAGTASPTPSRASSRVVVDKAGNNLIIQASAAEYQQWFALLRELDRPAKSALVSVTVAEVQLDESTNFGFEWIVNQLKLSNYTGALSTLGRLGVNDIGGVALTLNRGASPAMVLNALARTTKTRVLSNPSLMTRSGEEASISIGDEVPTVTSNQTTSTTSPTSPNVLQTIQYRSTGVILKVRPVVRNGGRIDLDVNQEVSNVKENAAGSTLTPSISKRSVTTKLTAIDGNTIVLGGLMTDNRNNTDSGVPYAKDVPLLGNLFKKRADSQQRTELVILITAYAIEDDFDAQSIADAVKRRFPWSTPLMSRRDVEQPSANEGPQASAAETSSRPEKPYQFKSTTSAEAPAAPHVEMQTATDMAPQHQPSVTAPPPRAALPEPPQKPLTVDKPVTDAKGVVTDAELKKELMEALGLKP